MLALVGAMLLDLGDQPMVVGEMPAHRAQHAVERRVAAVLIIDLDGGYDVEPPPSEPR
jgi:hypothetical protein